MQRQIIPLRPFDPTHPRGHRRPRRTVPTEVHGEAARALRDIRQELQELVERLYRAGVEGKTVDRGIKAVHEIDAFRAGLDERWYREHGLGAMTSPYRRAGG